MTVIWWIRQDFRLADNPALVAAAQAGSVLPVFILDDKSAAPWAMGAASRVWLHHALSSLEASIGGKIACYAGPADEILPQIVKTTGARSVQWNRSYEPWQIARDKKIKARLHDMGVAAESHNGRLLWEPWQIKKDDGTPYKVFTPFFRKGCLNAAPPRDPLDAPTVQFSNPPSGATTIDALGLCPDINWHESVITHWDISESGAQATLRHFVENGLSGYKEKRNLPDAPHVSRLSPYLHFGMISPHQIWAAVADMQDRDADHFRAELGWREFSYSLLFYNPDLPTNNLQQKFDAFPWQDDADALRAWQRGQTGIPIVDAGMRELWQTGYMHNRVRMIVASFLIKNLRIDWRKGEAWFWDTLFDADLANNAASWQWVAGSGADAAPYFRIFNPVTQAEKFDPDGNYIRRYVPEITKLAGKALFAPWTAKAGELEMAGITLGKTYPKPIVDLKLSREIALDAFKALPKNSD